MTGSAELGRQCTAGTKWDQEWTPAVHHTRSELEEMLRDRFGRTGTGRPDTSGTMHCNTHSRQTVGRFQAPNQNVVIHRVHRVAEPFQFFRIKRHGNIPTGTPPPDAMQAWKAQIAIVCDIAGYRSMICAEPVNNCDNPPCSSPHLRRRISESTLFPEKVDP